jgi:hypothetical protein
MQVTIHVFLAILLAHLLADFVLQTDAMVAAKKSRKLPYLQHGLIHWLALVASLKVFTDLPAWSFRTQVLLLTYVALHVVLDVLKNRVAMRSPVLDSLWLFLADQTLHLVAISALTWLFAKYGWEELKAAIAWSDARQFNVLITVVVYLAVIFGGGYLVRYLTRSLTLETPESKEQTTNNTVNREQTAENEKSAAQDLRNAGLYIGWLERFMVLTAVMVQSPAMIGLILTGKSIARFP